MLAPTIIMLWSLILSSSSAATLDVLKQGQVLNSSETIVSNGGIFELGFFSFGLANSTTQKRFYLGIWYKQANTNSNRTIVWVGNRDKPIITNSSCFLTINNDGNLAIYDQKGFSILTTSIIPTTNVTATLLDSGNFVLRQNKDDGSSSTTSSLLWQSFDFPTHTYLPEMKIGYNTKTGKTWKLTSWKSGDDPSPGQYSLLLNPERTAQMLILNGSRPIWTTGSWSGHNFRYTPEMAWSRKLYTVNYFVNGSENYFLISVLGNKSILTRYVMDYISGKIQQFLWLESSQSWVIYWEQPKQQCDVYSYCGSNSICDKGNYPYCKCLDGFQPNNLRDWNGGNWSGGCGRRSALRCGDQDGFLTMKNMSFPLDPKVLQLQSVDDCKSSCLGICACNAYGYSNNQCLVWYSSLHNVKQADYNGEDLFLKLPSSEIKIYEESNDMNSRSSNSSRNRAISLGLVLPITCLILILGAIVYCSRKRKSKQRERTETDMDLMLFDFTTKTKPAKREFSMSSKTVNGGIWDVELPFFSFSSVCSATNNFSNANKIGQGGFGPVYKGTLQNGHEVAIKRLSARSCQGLEELKNETTLIAKLQHRNLVKLLGCCIEGAEKILIYEYMTNKSLDLIIFDPKSQVKLSWERRANIIEGIAQGLLYLHQYSRLRIIHRDLKASNILLDDQLNPKISDFGMARIFEDNRSRAYTKRIVGTYGYMSPEYAMEGHFSIKSDVYSFGVLLLEILSGQKNSNFYPSNDSSSNLIGHAWELWQSERELELIDPGLGNSSRFAPSPTKYIQVALLCVQEKPIDRPTMSEVNAMLLSDSVGLPLPKQPAFSFGRGIDESSKSSRGKPSSINNITVSLTAR